MKGKREKKTFNLVLIFALVFSLFTPFGTNVSKAAEVISVSDAIANNSGTATVEGYIVGVVKGGSGANISYSHTAPFTVAANMAIADSADETDPSKILTVQLPSGSIRADLNLAEHPENLGKKVQITGSLEAYFSVAGLKSPTEYSFAEDADPAKIQAVTASPKEGAVAKGTQVELTTATEGAAIHYTLDGSEPSTSSTTYTEPIIINEPVTIKAIAVAEGLEDSEITAFNYTILQEKKIAEVRTLPLKTNVITSGIVTAVLGGTTYIQDETAGIVLYGYDLNVEPGDRVRASGELTEFNTLLEINVQPEDVAVLEKTEIPAAEELTAAELQEDKEGTLVTVKNVTVQSFSGGNYTAVDADGSSLQLRPNDASVLKVNTTYDSITGVLGAYNGVYQLIPRNAGDVIADSSKVQAVTATPGPGLVKEGDKVTLTTGTEGASIHYTTDGSDPTTSSEVYSEPIEIAKNTTVKALAVKAGLKNSEVAVFDYMIQKENIRIHDIQGADHYSLYDGQNVTDIEGIVTKAADGSNFYMQDTKPDNDPNTSEGILVYKKSHGLNEGDVVNVSGEVQEWVLEGYAEKKETDLPVTEINANTITVTASNQELPEPVVIGEDRIPPKEVIDNDGLTTFDPEQDGIDFFESLEAMLVQVNNPKVVAPQKYGELVVVPENASTNTTAGGLRISETDYNPERIAIDINDESFVAKMGDSFEGSIQGVVSYGFSNYKVLSDKANLPALVEGSNAREITPLTFDDKKLTIASYNVENFSTQTDDAKVTRLAEAIVKNMKQPDIIGLTEVQDNDGPTDSGTTDASESAAKLIAKIVELGGPKYTYTDIAPEDKADGGQPGGNIRVGFLYNADRVSLVPGTKGKATQSVDYENGKLTLNPGRIDPTNAAFDDSRKPLAAQFEFNGESIIVVANHFNSKGGDLPLFGKVQPPVLNSEVQRMKIAAIVNGFVKDVQAEDPNANIVLLGDFNDFEFSNPLQVLKGQELTNMIEKVPAKERYSYSYQGNAQVLDHILVSNNMAAKTKVDILHINSGFMEEHGRASDHDPVLIQTLLKEPVEIDESAFFKVYDLVGYKAKKLVIGPDNTLIKMDETSSITEGIWLKKSATLKGEGLKKTKVVISSASKDAVVDFTGTEVKEVLIEKDKVKEIRGAENVQKWTLGKKVDPSHIKFTNSKGEEIPSPFAPKENKAPVVVKTIENITTKIGEKVSIDLSEYFSDPDGNLLAYTATIGTLTGSTLTLPADKAGTSLVAITVKDGNGGEATVRFSLTVEELEQLEGYYEAASGKTGEDLKQALHNIISDQTKLSYKQVWDALKETDEDPNNPENVILLYKVESRSKNLNGGNAGDWNREHVWAKSHGDFGTSIGPGTDIHHLRPTDVQINSARSNLDFDNGGSAVNGCDGCLKTSNSWEPPDRVKGDVARMLFYMAVRYEGTNGEVDLELNESLNNGSNPYHGKLSVLLEWHAEDPVDDFERNRNNVIYEKWQHNRNPFIDHPEWAEEIW